MNSKSWAGDIQCDDNPSSICGLEISFVSADIQDIDIKLIPVNQFCNINNPGILQRCSESELIESFKPTIGAFEFSFNASHTLSQTLYQGLYQDVSLQNAINFYSSVRLTNASRNAAKCVCDFYSLTSSLFRSYNRQCWPAQCAVVPVTTVLC